MSELPELGERIRVVVVDDQRLFASGLAMLIEAQPDLVCVGTALDGRQAIALVDEMRPDVVLMDIRMPVLNGLDATRLILTDADVDGPPRIVVLTTIRKDEAVFAALAAGASAFLTKDAEPEVVLATIRAAHAGAPSPTFADTVALVEEFVPVPAIAPPSPDPGAPDALGARDALGTLTGREREILLLVARGPSNAEIASELFVSEATVKTHVRSLLQKLGLRSRIQIVILAYERGLIASLAPSPAFASPPLEESR